MALVILCSLGSILLPCVSPYASEYRCQLEDLPSGPPLRPILDGAPRAPLRRRLPQSFERMRRVGWRAQFVTEVAGEPSYPVALDGSEDFTGAEDRRSGRGAAHPHRGRDARFAEPRLGDAPLRAGSQAV